MWWDCLSQNVQCNSLAVRIGKVVTQIRLSSTKCAWHPLPVGYKKICDETALHKMFNVTHLLLVIGKNVLRLPLNDTYLLLVIGKTWWNCLSENVQCHSLSVGHSETAFHKTCNVTYSLLVIEMDMIRICLSKHVPCYPLSVGHRISCDETAFTTCAISLTCCWW